MGEALARIAFISDYMPRKCGIAVFTTDLCEAVAAARPDVSCNVVAMNDIPEGYAYPPRVAFQVTQNRIDEYRSAADFLNVTDAQAVCVQHEFGIYGGIWGAHL
ncbi:MAG: glycosyl transferase family 1, partial [Planctomycetota bacterium]